MLTLGTNFRIFSLGCLHLVSSMVCVCGANVYAPSLLSEHDIFVRHQSSTLGLAPKSWRILDLMVFIYECAALRILGAVIWSICVLRVVFGRIG